MAYEEQKVKGCGTCLWCLEDPCFDDKFQCRHDPLPDGVEKLTRNWVDPIVGICEFWKYY